MKTVEFKCPKHGIMRIVRPVYSASGSPLLNRAIRYCEKCGRAMEQITYDDNLIQKYVNDEIDYRKSKVGDKLNLVNMNLGDNNRTIKVQFKKLHEDAKIPVRAHKGDIGYDVFALEDTVLPAVKIQEIPEILKSQFNISDCVIEVPVIKVRTGLASKVEEGYGIEFVPRSGLSSKHNIILVNSPSSIDNGYRNEWLVPLFNLSSKDYHIKKHDRIVQCAIKPIYDMEITEVNELDDTERGMGGFNSTGR